jgi:hypothetical protein
VQFDDDLFDCRHLLAALLGFTLRIVLCVLEEKVFTCFHRSYVVSSISVGICRVLNSGTHDLETVGTGSKLVQEAKLLNASR